MNHQVRPEITRQGSKYHNSHTDATLAETKKAFTRRAIDQLGFVKDINSLVVLSGMSTILSESVPLFISAF